MSNKPTKEEALKAVETLISWAGDDPTREGLIETPDRVIRAYKEFFAGYEEDPEQVLTKTFEEVEGYDDAVIVRDIRVESHCEHHMVPIIGVAHVGYIPNNRVVGISKLARLVDAFGKDLSKSFGSMPGSTGKGAGVFGDVAKAAGIDSSGPYTGESYDAAMNKKNTKS